MAVAPHDWSFAMLENAFHKLKRPEDFETIKAEGLKPSAPAEIHWLGEGVYFFMDPKGHYWAKRWPCNEYNHRTDSPEGIIQTELTTDLALDFRNDEIRNKSRDIVNRLKLRLKFKGLPCTDGTAFALIFKEKIFKQVVPYDPTAIIANFDSQYIQYRIDGSGAFLTVDEMKIGKSAQIQACVIEPRIIGALALRNPT